MAGIDVEDHDFDWLIDLQKLRRMGDFARPRHLGNMDQSFDAAFQFDKGAVVHDADHLALHPLPMRYFSATVCQGSGVSCFMPREIRSFSVSNLSTTTLTVSPT